MSDKREQGLDAQTFWASLFLGALAIFVVVVLIHTSFQDSQHAADSPRPHDKVFQSLPASEHLAKAKKLLATNQVDDAIQHPQAIPSTAPEAEEAVKLHVDARTGKPQKEADDSVHQRQLAQEEKERGKALSSYWPSTVRVQTDMNSSWLDQEEGVCVSYPDDHGTVAVIHCEGPERPDAHNIPVTFWGSMDRGKSTNWKCRRESEKFVCRAMD